MDTKATEMEAKPAPEQQSEAETVQPEVGKDGKPFDAERAQKTIEQLRAEVKELKAKAKRADELEAEAKKRAEEEMSELERFKHKAEEAERRAQELAHRQAQRDAAEKMKLPLQFAERLKGETPEELEADAKLLLEAMPKPSAQTNTTNPSGQPAKETDAERRRRLGIG